MSEKAYYVTTPIYYVTAPPHIGSAYTTVAGDVLTRWHAQRGEQKWYLTGTDEHGEKVMRSAEAQGMSPQAWTDKLVEESWKPAWVDVDIAYDDFIRTTEQRHTERVREFWQKLYDKGDVYKGEYEGLYCVGCEEFKLADRHPHRRGRHPAVHDPRHRAGDGLGDQLLLPALGVRRQAARAVRVAAGLRGAGECAQRGDRVREAGAAGPVDHPVDVRLGHSGPVGRGPRPLRLDRRAAELRDAPRATAPTRSGSRSCGRPTCTWSARTSSGSTR